MKYCTSPGSPGFGTYRNGFHIAYPGTCVSYCSEDFNEDENKDPGRKIHALVPCQALQEEQPVSGYLFREVPRVRTIDGGEIELRGWSKQRCPTCKHDHGEALVIRVNNQIVNLAMPEAYTLARELWTMTYGFQDAAKVMKEKP